MRRIAIINQKGGVGKTTTTVNVGSSLARMGHRVLLIDLDPQAHLTLYLGQDPTAGQAGVYEMLIEGATVAKVRRKVGSNLWMCAASIDLAGAEVELVSVVGREVILRDLIDQHVNSNRTPPYDYVLMDCPPSLNVLTLNALCAANEVVIPLQPHYLALQGLSKLLETVAIVSKRINPTLKVTGVVVCMNETGTKLAGEVLEDVRAFFAEARGKDVPWRETRVFQSVVRRNIKLAESPSYGKSIFDYAPESNGAEDYQRLALELHSPQSVEEKLPELKTTVNETAVSIPEPAPAEAAAPQFSPEALPVPAATESRPTAHATPAQEEGRLGPAENQSVKSKPGDPARLRQIEKAGIDPALAETVQPKPGRPIPRRKDRAHQSSHAPLVTNEIPPAGVPERQPAPPAAVAASSEPPPANDESEDKNASIAAPTVSEGAESPTAAGKPRGPARKRPPDKAVIKQVSASASPSRMQEPFPAPSAQAM